MYLLCKSLQKRLKREKKKGNDFNIKRQLCIASNNVGDPDSKRSPRQASFRRDLRIITEAAGIGKCQLILSEDRRFLDSIIAPQVVRRKFRQSVRAQLGVSFNVHVQSLKEVILI